jgi:hypothetical protein
MLFVQLACYALTYLLTRSLTHSLISIIDYAVADIVTATVEITSDGNLLLVSHVESDVDIEVSCADNTAWHFESLPVVRAAYECVCLFVRAYMCCGYHRGNAIFDDDGVAV